MEVRFEDAEGRWWTMDVQGWRYRGEGSATFKVGGDMTLGFRSGEPLPEGHAVLMIEGRVRAVATAPSAQAVV